VVAGTALVGLIAAGPVRAQYEPNDPPAPTSSEECESLRRQWNGRITQLQDTLRQCQRSQCPDPLTFACLERVGGWSDLRDCGGFDTGVFRSCQPTAREVLCARPRSSAAYERCMTQVRAHQQRQRAADAKERAAQTAANRASRTSEPSAEFRASPRVGSGGADAPSFASVGAVARPPPPNPAYALMAQQRQAYAAAAAATAQLEAERRERPLGIENPGIAERLRVDDPLRGGAAAAGGVAASGSLMARMQDRLDSALAAANDPAPAAVNPGMEIAAAYAGDAIDSTFREAIAARHVEEADRLLEDLTGTSLEGDREIYETWQGKLAPLRDGSQVAQWLERHRQGETTFAQDVDGSVQLVRGYHDHAPTTSPVIHELQREQIGLLQRTYDRVLKPAWEDLQRSLEIFRGGSGSNGSGDQVQDLRPRLVPFGTQDCLRYFGGECR